MGHGIVEKFALISALCLTQFVTVYCEVFVERYDNSSRRSLLSLNDRLEHGEAALQTLRKTITDLYGTNEKTITDKLRWYTGDSKDSKLVNQMLKAVVNNDKFVIAVGGMSDTAGHGNQASESYPMVMKTALTPAFAAAGIELEVRNLAMGGVPSFPDSVCMRDNYGSDIDIIAWDFRMVEHDEIKGELFLRQALMMPKSPSVMFKRENRYLDGFAKTYGEALGLHAIDETSLFNVLEPTSGSALKNDQFCENKCTCPGQVRWHSGWKMQRLRGLQMAMIYSRILSKALVQIKTALADKKDVNTLIVKRDKVLLPAIKNTKALLPMFADHYFKCGLTWNPHIGRSLTDLIDTSSLAKGGTQWKLKDPNLKISEKGKACGYIDDKVELEGRVDDGWVFFNLKNNPPTPNQLKNNGHIAHINAKDENNMSAPSGTIGFCADFPKDKRLTDFEILVLLNGEEVQQEMKFWLDSRTLGISIQCYGTNKMVKENDNVLGFRVMENGIIFKLTHVIWR